MQFYRQDRRKSFTKSAHEHFHDRATSQRLALETAYHNKNVQFIDNIYAVNLVSISVTVN